MKSRFGKLLPPITSFVIIAIAAIVLWRKLAAVDPSGVAAARHPLGKCDGDVRQRAATMMT